MLITADERTLLFYKDNESARVKGRNKQPKRERERGARGREELETKCDRSTKRTYYKCNYRLTTHVRNRGEKTGAAQEAKEREEICKRV